MTIWVHTLDKKEVPSDFCNHFSQIYIDGDMPSDADQVIFDCPECDNEYSLSGLSLWTNDKSDLPPVNAVEAEIVDDNDFMINL